MNHKPSLQEEAARYVTEYYHGHKDRNLVYHDLEHTERVVYAAEKISRRSAIPERMVELAVISAWFHDIGYLVDPKDHEALSAHQAEEFLITRGVAAEDIQEVKSAILATRVPQSPSNLLGRILCDADLYTLAEDNLLDHTRKLYQERVNLNGSFMEFSEFLALTLDFMKNHTYLTDCGREILTPMKVKNMEKIREMLVSL